MSESLPKTGDMPGVRFDFLCASVDETRALARAFSNVLPEFNRAASPFCIGLVGYENTGKTSFAQAVLESVRPFSVRLNTQVGSLVHSERFGNVRHADSLWLHIYSDNAVNPDHLLYSGEDKLRLDELIAAERVADINIIEHPHYAGIDIGNFSCFVCFSSVQSVKRIITVICPDNVSETPGFQAFLKRSAHLSTPSLIKV